MIRIFVDVYKIMVQTFKRICLENSAIIFLISLQCFLVFKINKLFKLDMSVLFILIFLNSLILFIFKKKSNEFFVIIKNNYYFNFFFYIYFIVKDLLLGIIIEFNNKNKWYTFNNMAFTLSCSIIFGFFFFFILTNKIFLNIVVFFSSYFGFYSLIEIFLLNDFYTGYPNKNTSNVLIFSILQKEMKIKSNFISNNNNFFYLQKRLMNGAGAGLGKAAIESAKENAGRTLSIIGSSGLLATGAMGIQQHCKNERSKEANKVSAENTVKIVQSAKDDREALDKRAADKLRSDEKIARANEEATQLRFEIKIREGEKIACEANLKDLYIQKSILQSQDTLFHKSDTSAIDASIEYNLNRIAELNKELIHLRKKSSTDIENETEPVTPSSDTGHETESVIPTSNMDIGTELVTSKTSGHSTEINSVCEIFHLFF